MQIEFSEFRLENNIRVVLSEFSTTNAVAANFIFGVGSRFEDEKLSGSSHLFEHMLFKGTKNKPSPKQISSIIENQGGTINAFTDKEITGYWANFPKEHTRPSIELFSDMIQNSLMRNQDLILEKNVVIEEIKSSLDNPYSVCITNYEKETWINHSMGRDVAGTEKSVNNLTIKSLKAFYKKFYTPDNLVISISGNIDKNNVIDQLENNFKNFNHKKNILNNPIKTNSGYRQISVKKDIEQSIVIIGFKSPDYLNEKKYALSLISVILGESMGSRLFEEIREKRGLVYDIHSSINLYSDTGVIYFEAGVDDKNLLEVIKLIFNELNKIKNLEIDEQELNSAKNLSVGRLLLRLENSRSISNFLGTQKILSNKITDVNEIISKINNVTLNDIKILAKEIFIKENLCISKVGPKNSMIEDFSNIDL